MLNLPHGTGLRRLIWLHIDKPDLNELTDFSTVFAGCFLIWRKTHLQYGGESTNTRTHTLQYTFLLLSVVGLGYTRSVNYLCFMTDRHPLSKHLNLSVQSNIAADCVKRRDLHLSPNYHVSTLSLCFCPSRLLQTTRNRLVFCSLPVFEPF